jgi:hypothetical protein
MTLKKVGGIIIGIIFDPQDLQGIGVSAIVETLLSFGVIVRETQVEQ